MTKKAAFGDPLTPKQAEFVRYIKSHIREQGWPPTCVEIANHFGWASENASHEYIRLIEAKGYISRVRGISRGLRINPLAESV